MLKAWFYILLLFHVSCYAQLCDCRTPKEFTNPESYFCKKCDGDGQIKDLSQGSNQCKDCMGNGKRKSKFSEDIYDCTSCNATGLPHFRTKLQVNSVFCLV